MRSIWDVFLDVGDAGVLLDALVVLESHRAVREPLPLEDADRLLDRLRTIARIAEEEAVYWAREATDRREEAAADGGRWGDTEVAARMREVAAGTSAGSQRIAAAAAAAADDLAPRLLDGPSDASRAARESVVRQAEELLRRRGDGTGS